MEQEHELDELWQSAEWKSARERQTRRILVDMRIAQVLFGLAAAGLFILAIWAVQGVSDLRLIPVAPVFVVLVVGELVLTALFTVRGRMLSRRDREEMFHLASEYRARKAAKND